MRKRISHGVSRAQFQVGMVFVKRAVEAQNVVGCLADIFNVPQ